MYMCTVTQSGTIPYLSFNTLNINIDFPEYIGMGLAGTEGDLFAIDSDEEEAAEETEEEEEGAEPATTKIPAKDRWKKAVR